MRWIFLSVVLGLAACAASSSQPDTDPLNPELEIGSVQPGDTGETVTPRQPFDWCLPNTPPDWACYAQKRDPDSENIGLARAMADKQVEEIPAESLAWNWEEAVLMLSLVELHRVTGEQAYLDYFRKWMDHHIQQGYKIGLSDTCVPAAVAISLLQHTGEEKYRTVVEEALHYLYEVAYRTKEGGISHLGVVDIVTLWVDSLYMFGNVLVGWGEYSDDQQALDEFGTQFDIFTELLQEEAGFYKHAYQWIMEQDDNVYWGRGNGWVAVAAYQYLRVRTNRGESDESVAAAAADLLTAALAAQDEETGLWWTIVNHPGEVYLETSAAALFAFAFARAYRYGFADESILAPAALAINGVKSRIETDDKGRPVVTGISGPTTAGNFDTYAKVPLGKDLPFGLGAVILALVETSGLPTR